MHREGRSDGRRQDRYPSRLESLDPSANLVWADGTFEKSMCNSDATKKIYIPRLGVLLRTWDRNLVDG